MSLCGIFCRLAAGVRAIREVKRSPADDYFVFLISDANLEGYGVRPETLASALTSDADVNAFAFFIAERDTAEEMKANMPSGRAHVVMDTEALPLLFKNIFSRALLAERQQSSL